LPIAGVSEVEDDENLQDETAGVNEDKTTGVDVGQIESDDEPLTDVRTGGVDN
jgi:hypothetical protein